MIISICAYKLQQPNDLFKVKYVLRIVAFNYVMLFGIINHSKNCIKKENSLEYESYLMQCFTTLCGPVLRFI